MPVDLLLSRGIVIVEGREAVGSVGISSGKIEGIYKVDGEPTAAERIDCEGMYILPGAIDIHVHLRDLGESDKETFESGTMAAAVGGVTTVVDMPNSKPPILSNEDLEGKIACAEIDRYVNVGFYAGIPKRTEDFDRAMLPQILGMKVYPHAPLDKGTRYSKKRALECMKLSAQHNIPLLLHPDAAPRARKVKKLSDYLLLHSCESEVKSLKMFLSVRDQVRGRLHVCHVSCGTTARLIAENRAEETLTAEVTPHHLFLSGGEFSHNDGTAKMLPPLRSPYDNQALLEGLTKTCAIDCVASDHAPHRNDEKTMPFLEAAAGTPGLETTVPLMLTEVFNGNISWIDYLRFCCSGPAKILNIHGKGVLTQGYDADIVVVAKEEWEIHGSDFHSKAKVTPFEGRRVSARPMITMVEGNVVYDRGEFLADPGMVGKVPVRKVW
ncbi:MAG: dihydroorotase [Candidatus Thorarchaeota archaeon]|jgi:dihydroorotase